jgi:hypothetical protein
MNKKEPTFLGIGVPKAGSTWLYEILSSHPNIWVPPQRREVHYLDRHFDRGMKWYSQFFPPEEESTYSAIGEVTPQYLYCCPEKIKFLSSHIEAVDRFILILRNPVERAYSHYWFRKRIDGFEKSFEQFLDETPHVIEQGYYYRHLNKWTNVFSKDQFLFLQFETIFEDVKKTRKKIANFLGVSSEIFPESAGERKVNSRHMPKFKTAYAWAVSLGRWLRRKDLYGLTSMAESLNVKEWFGRSEVERKPMNDKTRYRLRDEYSSDLESVQELPEIDIEKWWIP